MYIRLKHTRCLRHKRQRPQHTVILVKFHTNDSIQAALKYLIQNENHLHMETIIIINT